MSDRRKIRFTLGYNEACTKDFADVIADIEYAAEAGFDTIELRCDCLQAYLDRNGRPADLRSAVEDSGLALGPLNALYIYPGLPETTPARKSLEFHAAFDLLRLMHDEIGISQAIAVAPLFENRLEARGYSRNEAFEMCVSALTYMCRELPDVTFAFEPVSLERSLVRDVSFAREIAAAVGAHNHGLVLDSCNLFLKEHKSAFDFSMMNPGEIAAVHLMNGIKPQGDGEILDQSWRRFLGDGDWVDTGKFMEEIRRTGYSGMISTEVFNPEYERKYSQRQIIKMAYDSLQRELIQDG